MPRVHGRGQYNSRSHTDTRAMARSAVCTAVLVWLQAALAAGEPTPSCKRRAGPEKMVVVAAPTRPYYSWEECASSPRTSTVVHVRLGVPCTCWVALSRGVAGANLTVPVDLLSLRAVSCVHCRFTTRGRGRGILRVWWRRELES